MLVLRRVLLLRSTVRVLAVVRLAVLRRVEGALGRRVGGAERWIAVEEAPVSDRRETGGDATEFGNVEVEEVL